MGVTLPVGQAIYLYLLVARQLNWFSEELYRLVICGTASHEKLLKDEAPLLSHVRFVLNLCLAMKHGFIMLLELHFTKHFIRQN